MEEVADAPVALPPEFHMETLLEAVTSLSQSSDEMVRHQGYRGLAPRPIPTAAELEAKVLALDEHKRAAIVRLFSGPDARERYLCKLGVDRELLWARSLVRELCIPRPMPERWKSILPLPELEVVGYCLGMLDGIDWDPREPKLLAQHINKKPKEVAELWKSGIKRLHNSSHRVIYR